MPRQARIVIPDIAHHITQRGNYRQAVFDNNLDFKQYCEWINEYAEEKNMDVLAYCLISNHVHFIVVPKAEKDLSMVFKTVHMRYAHYINRRRQAKGHLWQGRFYSCVLDDVHLYRAIRYVENNPVRANIVKRAWDYEYSSAKDHAKERDKPLIRLSALKGMEEGEPWQEYLQENDFQLVDEIRLKTNRGLVIGTNRFVNKLEKLLNRSLECAKQGRPRKDG